jgi:hypothetical protein
MDSLTLIHLILDITFSFILVIFLVFYINLKELFLLICPSSLNHYIEHTKSGLLIERLIRKTPFRIRK